MKFEAQAEKFERNYEAIPNGFYKVKIAKCEDYERRESVKNPGVFFSGIKIMLVVEGEVDPETHCIVKSRYSNWKIFDNVLLYAKNEYGDDVRTDGIKKSIEINRKKINYYTYAVGINAINDTEMLIGGELVVKVVSKEDKNSGRMYTNVYDCNRCSDYEDRTIMFSNNQDYQYNNSNDQDDNPF